MNTEVTNQSLRPEINEVLTAVEKWINCQETNVDGEVWLSLAVAYQALGKQDAASHALDKSSTAKYETMPFQDRIILLYDNKWETRAEAMIRQLHAEWESLPTESEQSNALENLSFYYACTNQIDEALAITAKIPDTLTRKLRLQSIVRCCTETNLEQARIIVRENNLEIDGNRTIAEELIRLNRTDGAKLVVEEIAQQVSQLPEEERNSGNSFLITFLASLGEIERAKQLVGNLLALPLSQVKQALLNMGLIQYYVRIQDFESALVYAQKVYEFRKTSGPVYFSTIALAQAKAGQVESAHALLTRLKETREPNTDVSEISRLASHFAKIGSANDAISLWNSIYRSRPTAPTDSRWMIPLLSTVTMQAKAGLAYA